MREKLRRSFVMCSLQCINDRPIRIDVAARTLAANKPEGFRNKRNNTRLILNNNPSHYLFS